MKLHEINFFGDDAVMSNSNSSPSGSEPHPNSPPEMGIMTQPRGSRSYMMTRQMYNNNMTTTRSQPRQFPRRAHMMRHNEAQSTSTRHHDRVFGAPETSMDMYLGGSTAARFPYDVVPFSSVASGSYPVPSLYPILSGGGDDEEHDDDVATGLTTRYLIGALERPINPYYPYLALTDPFDHVHVEVDLDLKL